MSDHVKMRRPVLRTARTMVRPILFMLLFAATHASLLLVALLLLRPPFSYSRILLCSALYGVGTLVILYLLFHPRSQWLVPSRSQVECERGRCVALTFDDGPNAERTPELLRILEEKGVKATFFVVGERAERNAELLRRMQAEGHHVANHTYSHPALFCFLTPARLRREIRATQEIIARTCGVRARCFRSPVGQKNPWLGGCLEEEGLEYVSWRVRAFDTFVQKPGAILERILGGACPGDIVLLHDNPGPASVVTLQVLPELIDGLRQRGFEFVLL